MTLVQASTSSTDINKHITRYNSLLNENKPFKALEELKTIIQFDLENCDVILAENNIQIASEIFEKNNLSENISSLWFDLALFASQTPCQNAWAVSDKLFYEGFKYISETGENYEIKQYVESVAKFYDDYYVKRSYSDYLRKEIIPYATKYWALSGNQKKVDFYIDEMNALNATNDLLFQNMFDLEISLCEQQICDLLYVNNDLRIRTSYSFGALPPQKVYFSGSIKTPSGKIKKISRTSVEKFTPKETGFYLIKVSADIKGVTLSSEKTFEVLENKTTNSNEQKLKSLVVFLFMLLFVMLVVLFFIMRKKNTNVSKVSKNEVDTKEKITETKPIKVNSKSEDQSPNINSVQNIASQNQNVDSEIEILRKKMEMKFKQEK